MPIINGYINGGLMAKVYLVFTHFGGKFQCNEGVAIGDVALNTYFDGLVAAMGQANKPLVERKTNYVTFDDEGYNVTYFAEEMCLLATSSA